MQKLGPQGLKRNLVKYHNYTAIKEKKLMRNTTPLQYNLKLNLRVFGIQEGLKMQN